MLFKVPSRQGPPEPCGLTYHDLGGLCDSDIMTHLAAGHGDAITVLFDRYARLVLRIALKRLHDQGEAEDLTQEVFVDLCRTAAQFDPVKGSAKMWIVRAASLRALNRRRQLTYRQFYSASDIAQIEACDAVMVANDGGVLPSMTLAESQRLAREVLAVLDGAARRVVELIFFEGLSMQEVATRTGDSLASVRHRYYRSMDRMRRTIERGPLEQDVKAAGETLNAKA